MYRPTFFESIVIAPPFEKIYRRLGYEQRITRLKETQKSRIDHFIQEANSLVALKGTAVRIPVEERGASHIVLSGGGTFKSRDLTRMLAGCVEAILMGTTAGKRISEAVTQETLDNNLTRGVVYDAVASEMVDAALKWIMNYTNRELRREGKQLLPKRFSAGYGDFGLENQKIIYDLLQLSRLDVILTEHCVLIPEKSVTAVSGIVRR